MITYNINVATKASSLKKNKIECTLILKLAMVESSVGP